MKSLFLLLCVILMSACAHQTGSVASTHPEDTTRDPTIDAWINPFKDDPQLAGVIVQQLPENPYDQKAWLGKHPSMIEFFFWDGRVQQRDYEPDGTQTDSFWWPSTMKVNRNLWDQVDFTQGADPTFKQHADPRQRR